MREIVSDFGVRRAAAFDGGSRLPCSPSVRHPRHLQSWIVALALVALSAWPTAASAATPAPLSELFEQRVRSVVAVEFVVESETERRPSTVVGLVADDQGLIVLLDTAVPGWLPPAQLKEFRVHTPGSKDGVAAEYLGQDFLTNWHFLRVGEELRPRLVPCPTFATGTPAIGDEIWGVGIMGRDFDFQPFLLGGRVSLLQELPQQIGFAMEDVASPGSPVFARDGAWVGWAGNPVPQERLLYVENERLNVGIQNVNGTGSFFLVSEVRPYLDRVPAAPTGQAVPWLGVVGLQPVEPAVAEFLKLENRAAVVVSDVIPHGPAAQAGLEKRDIILSLDGEPFPRFSPERVVTSYLERAILLRAPGDVVRFGIARGGERRELSVTLGQQPKPLKEAERRYFPRLGITVREFVLFDRVSRRLTDADEQAVVANFVKPNSPADAAGLRVQDLITQIDGRPVADYASAIATFEAIEADTARAEFVLLASRGTETQVIRVRLK